MGILDRVSSSRDIKNLDQEDLYKLCRELREFEVDSISRTGGHLASNLGTVELSVALHRVYDTTRDRLVFDVGHQCYTHKIITGRKDQFSTLRCYGGLSGFPKPRESVDDAFIAGHASNSISVALGMARARTIAGEDYDVVALIGDGALTGGLAYEGLADAAASGEPMVIILNDNNMSINENVGGISHMLQTIRIKPAYISFKKWFRAISKRMPVLYSMVHAVKEWIKSWLLPSNVFSEMGLYYLGPVDGHDLDRLESAIRLAKDMEKPVLLHVLTVKGRGCSYATEHPDTYHGVGPFDPKTGELKPSGPSFSDKMGQALCYYGGKDPRIVTITAAMSGGTGTECFAAMYPDRFFDIGIAEGHGVAMAAGMAKQGLIPVFAVYSSFLQRGFDMLIHDVALQRLHAVFCVDRAGLVGSDGETHQGVFDVSYLSTVPHMSILCPASFSELHDMLGLALLEMDGPVALRYPRGGEGEYKDSNLNDECLLRQGKDISLVGYGTMINELLSAARELSALGIEAEVIKLGRIHPNSFEQTLDSVRKTGRLLVAEDVCSAGCVGEQILSLTALKGVKLKAAELLNLGEGIVAHGSVPELMRACGIDAASISSRAQALCAEVLIANEETKTGPAGI